MKKEAKDKHFIKKPVYKGGPSAMKKFIGKHLEYPKQALENKTEGTVYVRYDIDHKGKVTDAKVIKGLGYGCDEEALRLVKMLEFKVPKSRGVRVLFHKNIQIHFRLPKQKPATEAPSFRYEYIENAKSGDQEKPLPGGYSYTIRF